MKMDGDYNKRGAYTCWIWCAFRTRIVV
ncbi:hypothetical protein F383_02042 [Gossypium arboreum]|uniref:Uncharacterized protein n=1 Tax=Gossypium arboreum TaxID=29729 RepID=A0A0B0Q3A5_GOSAR|nr:hypothetical protein F383_02042 [Gossypium arboreum]